MKELIEKLKDKTYVRAFGLMSPEEQECFKKVKQKNCLIFCTDCSWDETLDIEADYVNIYTYAIKPDYQPEPEFVDLEITKCTDSSGVNKLGCWLHDSGLELTGFMHLHCLPSLPNFEGFWHDYDKKMGRRYFCNITEAAPKISEGKKVYARFRGQGQ